MSETPDRRAELIAAAASGSLSPDEERELDGLRQHDPSISAEIDDLRDLIAAVTDAVPSWDPSPPPPSLRDAVVGIPEATPAAPAPVARLTPLRRILQIVAVAAALVIGVGIGALAFPRAGSGVAESEPGVPGQLGARETISFAGAPSGVRVDGAIVAHTWGTETILEIDGLPVGRSYSVVVIGDDGSEISSGSFLGSTVEIDCRMNAATLRPDAVSVEIQDADGRAVAVADLPEVA